MKILTFDIEEWFHILDHESTKNESSWNKYENRIEKKEGSEGNNELFGEEDLTMEDDDNLEDIDD